ncbi:putative fAD dependent oxidoreductase domain protein [Enterobacter roggenkampii]|nr:putative fAD dependent oxidoreductase domain protein [Enterobacter roggenkampii]
MFCERIGADCDLAPAKIQKMVNPKLINACFSVKEFAFDAFKLRDIMLERLREGANKQVISSQADSLIKISRIWADFFPANTSNQPI